MSGTGGLLLVRYRGLIAQLVQGANGSAGTGGFLIFWHRGLIARLVQGAYCSAGTGGLWLSWYRGLMAQLVQGLYRGLWLNRLYPPSPSDTRPPPGDTTQHNTTQHNTARKHNVHREGTKVPNPHTERQPNTYIILSSLVLGSIAAEGYKSSGAKFPRPLYRFNYPSVDPTRASRRSPPASKSGQGVVEGYQKPWPEQLQARSQRVPQLVAKENPS